LYDELYEAWRKEKESEEIQALPRDFFAKLADYVSAIKEEGRMLDKKTLRGRLLLQEREKVARLTEELVRARYEKIMRLVSAGRIVPGTSLTEQETSLYEKTLPSTESYLGVLDTILQGRLSKVEEKVKSKNVMVRILREIPAIIGVDMRTYGPFKPEDVASLPIENARILIEEQAAEEIEVT
jgi:DNA replication factor GINS